MRSFGGHGAGLPPAPMNLRSIRMLKSLDGSVRSGGATSSSTTTDSCCPTASFTTKDGKKDSLSSTSPRSSASPTTSPEHSWPSYCPFPDADVGWVCVDAVNNEKTSNGFLDDHVFARFPSPDEAQEAISSLQGVLAHATSGYGVMDDSVLDDTVKDESVWDDTVKYDSVRDGTVKDKSESESESEGIIAAQGFGTSDSSSATAIGNFLDWIEPSLQICNSNMLHRPPRPVVCDALYMLKHDPVVQRMVVSISSDNVVWDAVLNNEVVREIRKSLKEAAEGSVVPSKASKSGDFFSSFIDSLKAKIKGLIDSLRMAVMGLTCDQRKYERKYDAAEVSGGKDEVTLRQVRVSFMLSMMVFLMVVLKRMGTA